ncbi:DNA-3-methyladenine glycosylase I [Tranquillimonas rosea]|uniref:DNA-3-methyladenine glycosylase I n=1 Tax=Tranquillimonas rosea TaxID=641238 RepID=UPI003BA93467
MGERCDWCGTDPLYVAYHDHEWGVPEFDSRALWEKLVLDGFQAGLSWLTILRKRENFRTAFEGFDPERIAGWGEPEIARCLADPGIVRHRGKIEATIDNARGFLEIEDTQGFYDFVWAHVGHVPVQNAFASMAEVPAQTPLSQDLSKKLRGAGFRFCGPTIVYAWLQATGVVNDHLVGCPIRPRVAAMAPGTEAPEPR